MREKYIKFAVFSNLIKNTGSITVYRLSE